MARLACALLLAACALAQTPIPGPVIIGPTKTAGGVLQLREVVANGTHATGWRAPATLAGDVIYEMPAADGGAGDCFTTDGAGVTSWAACGGGYWIRSGTTLDTATAGDHVDIDGLLTLSSHLRFTAPSVTDIGTATNYAQTLYIENIDAAPSGVTNNYLKGRKLEVADDAGGTGFWDIQSKANATNSTLYIRDAGGGNVIDFHRIDATSAVDYANVYVDLYPDSGGSQKLGKSGQHWGQLWATDTYSNYLHAITGTVVGLYADLVPITNNTYDLGATAARVKKLWVVDIDCSGTCPGGSNYWTRTGTVLSTTTANDDVEIDGLLTLGNHLLFGAPSVSDIGSATNYFQTAYGENANFAPSGVTANYTKIRKLEVVDDAGGTSFWDFQSKANATNSTLYLRDAAGGLVVDFHRIDSTAAVDYANFYVDLYPDSGGSQKLGKSGQQWGQMWATDSYTNYLHQISGSYIYSYAHFAPIANATYDLGDDSTPLRWRNFAFTGAIVQGGTTRLDASGNLTVTSCTGCGASYWTRSGGDVFPATNGDDITVKTGGGTQTHRLRASDGAHLAGSIHTGASPTWTQRIDSSGNFTGLSLVINGTWTINSTGAANLGSVFVTDLFQGVTSRLNSSGVFNGASYNVAGTEVISSGRIGKFVSLDINGTSNVIDNSRNATFLGLTFGGSSTLTQGVTTRISSAGKGTFVGLEFGGSSSLDQGGTARIDSSGVGHLTSLNTGAGAGTQRIDSSGNMYTPSITISGSWAIGSGGTAVLGSVFATDYWQGATARINSSGVFNAASYSVAGTSVVDSSRNASFVSLTINGTSAINSSRNTNFNNLVWTNQLWGPFTVDTGMSFASSAGKIAYYDTGGNFKGWIPVLP